MLEDKRNHQHSSETRHFGCFPFRFLCGANPDREHSFQKKSWKQRRDLRPPLLSMASGQKFWYEEVRVLSYYYQRSFTQFKFHVSAWLAQNEGLPRKREAESKSLGRWHWLRAKRREEGSLDGKKDCWQPQVTGWGPVGDYRGGQRHRGHPAARGPLPTRVSSLNFF